MSIFGWSYPAGAENDPNAPYNQSDHDPCPHCGADELDDENEDFCGACGEAVTAPPEHKAYYCHTLEAAEFMAARAELATGTDYCVEIIRPGVYRIAPSRVVTVGSAAIAALYNTHKERP